MVTRSALHQRLIGQPPEARQAEDVFDEHGAGDQEGELQPDDRDDRQERVRHHVAEQRLAPRQALGARGAHEILPHHVEDGRAGDTREDAGLGQGERDGGHDEGDEARPGRRRPSPGKPPDGIHPSQDEKTRTRISPIQKFGMATPTGKPAGNTAPGTAGPSRRAAAMIPSGSAMAIERTMASTASGKVTANRSEISPATGT